PGLDPLVLLALRQGHIDQSLHQLVLGLFRNDPVVALLGSNGKGLLEAPVGLLGMLGVVFLLLFLVDLVDALLGQVGDAAQSLGEGLLAQPLAGGAHRFGDKVIERLGLIVAVLLGQGGIELLLAQIELAEVVQLLGMAQGLAGLESTSDLVAVLVDVGGGGA